MNSEQPALSASWYRGVWGLLVRWFRVPDHPPTLPVRPGARIESFKPSLGFLRYLRFQFWLVVGVLLAAILALSGAVAIAAPLGGVALAVALLGMLAVLALVIYLSVHLRYDTTWYVFTDRSLRIRRGIWVIHETTITFENVQNVKVTQGPLQRWFGISTLLVETAGGGGGSDEEPLSQHHHRGLIEGIRNAHELRDKLLRRLRHSRTAGLGDDLPLQTGWSAAHLAVLREIRDLARQRG